MCSPQLWHQKDRALPVEMIQCDFSTISLSHFSVVVIYLGRDGNSVVKKKLCAECAAGTIVISVGVSEHLLRQRKLNIFLHRFSLNS